MEDERREIKENVEPVNMGKYSTISTEKVSEHYTRQRKEARARERERDEFNEDQEDELQRIADRRTHTDRQNGRIREKNLLGVYEQH